MKRRKVVDLFDDDSLELDELVTNELLALEQQTVERMKQRRKNMYKLDPEKEKVKKREDPQENLPEVPDNEKRPHFYEDGEISPVFEVDVDTEQDELFDESEERFISASVSYLRAKDNKDAIISRIWNRLTESEPDAFYSPEEETLSDNNEREEESTPDKDVGDEL